MQSHHLSTTDIKSHTTIHTIIGLPSKIGASNRNESIINGNSIEKAKNQRYSISWIKRKHSNVSHSQVNQM